MLYSKIFFHLVALLISLNVSVYALANPVKLPQLLCHHKTSTCLHYTVTKTKTVEPVKTRCPTATVTDTKTTTKTVTKVVTTSKVPAPTGACPIVDPKCKPVGWDLDYYPDPFLGWPSPYTGDTPGFYISQKLKPLAHALTNITYFPQDTPPTTDPVIYPNATYPDEPYYVGYTRNISGIVVDGNNYTIVYEGLYKAPVSGKFTFCSEADNEAAVFFGAGDGFPCGGKPSPDAPPSVVGSIATGGNYMDPTSCFYQILVKESYYPLRIVMGNWQGPSALGFTITPPAGNATYDLSGYMYSPACASKV